MGTLTILNMRSLIFNLEGEVKELIAAGDITAIPSLNLTGLHIPPDRIDSLDLTCCNIPWDEMATHDWPSLTTLKLRSMSRPPGKQFHDFLANAPNLKVLELYASLPAVLAAVGSHTVKLPNLVSCFVEGSPFAECSDFQESVDYPENAKFTVLPA